MNNNEKAFTLSNIWLLCFCSNQKHQSNKVKQFNRKSVSLNLNKKKLSSNKRRLVLKWKVSKSRLGF